MILGESTLEKGPNAFGHLSDHAIFTEVLAASSELPPSPRFLFGLMPAPVARIYFSRSLLPPGGMYQASGLVLSEGFVLSKAGRTLIAPQLNLSVAHVEAAIAEFGLPPAATPCRRLDGPHALITGPGYKIYGHWLADMLPRLAVLTLAGVDLDGIRLLVAEDLPPFAEQMLDLLGFDETRRVRFGRNAGSVLVDELLLPTFLHNGVRYSRILQQAVSLLRERVESRHGSLAQGDFPKRILVARTGVGQRVLIEREAIEAECLAAGFVRVTPERLPLLEQWRMFNGARQIIGEYGSALHNSLFSQPGMVLCGLRGSKFHPAFIQSGFGDILEQPTGYIFGETVEDTTDHFRIRLDHLKDCLQSVFGKALVPAYRKQKEQPRSDSIGAFTDPQSSTSGLVTGEFTIDFAGSGNSAGYRVSGWSAQEENHIWSVGKVSVLALPQLDPLQDWHATLDVGTLIAPPIRTSQSLQVEVNGQIAGTFSVASRETLLLRIPREQLGNADELRLRFVHPDCLSPRAAGAGEDDRNLAFSFYRLTLSSLPSEKTRALPA